MFSGQPPGPPPPSPGLPGQPSLLQAAPGAPRSSPSTLVDELESSFEVKWDVRVSVPSLFRNVSCCTCAAYLLQRSLAPGMQVGSWLRECKSFALVFTVSGAQYSAWVCWRTRANLTFLEVCGLEVCPPPTLGTCQVPASWFRPTRFLFPSPSDGSRTPEGLVRAHALRNASLHCDDGLHPEVMGLLERKWTY